MEATAESIWSAAQGRIRGMLSPDTYNLWFAPLKALARDEDALTLSVANDFCEVWLKDNYMGLLQEMVAMSSGRQMNVRFQIRPDLHAPAPGDKPIPVVASSLKAPATSGRAAAAGEIAFNPNCTFDTFVVGANNNFSYAAALAVAQAPGKAYNPLFLYGGVGLGKTHLLHAIGNHVVANRKNPRVAFVTSERFTNDYIEAIQNNQLAKFRKKYRLPDVLLIDDVQFLAGKERIQEEFFHTFNSLHEARKQIVLTCDRPAGEIDGLEQRLVSRFEWGLVTDLQPPDVEVRLAILQKKAAMLGADLPADVMSFLANRIRLNIRRLEGALIRVASYAALTGTRVTVHVVETLLRELLQEESRPVVNIDVIQRKVAETFDIRVADMMTKRRPESIAFPRQVAMYLSRQMTDYSLNAIGEAFGGRDHGTVMHACRQVKDRMEVDPSVRQVVIKLERELAR